MTRLPFIFSAHHAGNNFGEYSRRVALTAEQRIRYSDYGTELTVPQNGAVVLIGAYSRGIVDLNREPGNHDFFRQVDFAQPTPNDIWILGQSPTREEHASIFKDIYQPYHDRLLREIRSLKKPGIVVSWDNTAPYDIGKDDAGRVQQMKSFILSNRGAEGTAGSIKESTTCDPELLQTIVRFLRISLRKAGLPTDVYLNHVFKGGYVAERYNSLRHPELRLPFAVQSFQVEYNTALTHDPVTLEPNKQGIRAVRTAFEEALGRAYFNYFLD